MNIVSFSGGKDSTAMLLMMLEKGIRVDRVVCVDTTKEFPQMYEHIAKVQEMIKPLEIEIVKIDFDYWFGERIKLRGKHMDVPGYGWPGPLSRWCTRLKIKAMKKLKTKSDINFIGISYNEKHRTERDEYDNSFRFPLVEWQVTGKQALEYCYAKGFLWGGLYEKMGRVSCWCCPLSRIGNLKILHDQYPQLWEQLLEMDKKSHLPFKGGRSVLEFQERFVKEKVK